MIPEHLHGTAARRSFSSRRRWPVLAGGLLLGLLSIGLSLWLLLPRVSATEHLADGSSGPVYPMWAVWVDGVNRLDLDLQAGRLTPMRWKLAYRGRLHLRINQQEVPLGGPPAQGGGWTSLTLDCSPWLQRGHNHFEFTVETEGVPDVNAQPVGGISFIPILSWRLLLIWAGFIPWLLALAGLFRLPRQQTLILALALQILCLYTAGTPWNVRAHDVMYAGGHVAYIAYVASHLALPPPNLGWTFYHPPLYYMVAAAVWRWAQWLGLPGQPVLQYLSLTLWLVFLAASAAALKLSLRRPPQVLQLATAALALWPSGIMHGIAIDNDAALYASSAVATWFLLRFWRSGSRAHLLGAALSVAVALLCKSNGIVVAAALGLLLGLRLLRRPDRRRWIDAAIAAALTGTGLLLSMAMRLYYYWSGRLSDWLISNVDQLPTGLRVPGGLHNFLPLQIKLFLSQPWMSALDDATGRANFWNFLLRSALSGEANFGGATARPIALIWGFVLLGLVLLPLRSLVRCSRRQSWRDAPLLALGLLWLASLLALRIRMPYASSNDFRYILPVLVPFLVGAARSGVPERLALFAMALSSPLFFIFAA